MQTNEVRRCAFLTPAVLAAARIADPAPLALIEVGAAAGLSLLVDRYGYRYTAPGWQVDITGDPGAPQLSCTVHSALKPPVADSMPDVAWRAGIDLNPLDATDPADRQWLSALVWPDHRDRAVRLAAALVTAAIDPPEIHQGDAIDGLPELAGHVPPQAQLVIYHCAVLAHSPLEAQARFTQTVLDCSRTREVLWIQAEPRPDYDPRRLRLTTCANGQVTGDLAWGSYQPHGEWLDWAAETRLSR